MNINPVNVKIIAHRGISKLAHENTIPSFLEALRFHPDMIEFDVRETKDGVLIIHHDKKINGVLVKEMTHAEITNHYKQQSVEIPVLSEVVEFSKKYNIKLDIELKEKGYEKKVLDEVLAELPVDQFVIKSFHDHTVKTLKKTNPSVTVGLLLKELKGNETQEQANRQFYFEQRVLECQADFISPHYSLVKLDFLERAKNIGLPVYIWTVNDEQMLRDFLANENVTVVVTDNCDTAHQIRSNKIS